MCMRDFRAWQVEIATLLRVGYQSGTAFRTASLYRDHDQRPTGAIPHPLTTCRSEWPLQMVFFYGKSCPNGSSRLKKNRPDHYPVGSEMGMWSRRLRCLLDRSTEICQVAASARRCRCRTRKGQFLFA